MKLLCTIMCFGIFSLFSIVKMCCRIITVTIKQISLLSIQLRVTIKRSAPGIRPGHVPNSQFFWQDFRTILNIYGNSKTGRSSTLKRTNRQDTSRYRSDVSKILPRIYAYRKHRRRQISYKLIGNRMSSLHYMILKILCMQLLKLVAYYAVMS